MFDIYTATLTSALAASGTFTFSYLPNKGIGSYLNAVGHKASIPSMAADLVSPTDFTLTFNATNVTFTLGSGKTTMPIGTTLSIQAERVGQDSTRVTDLIGKTMQNSVYMPTAFVDLGSPIVGAATQVTTAQLKGAAGTLTIDGVLAAAGVATADVPRNVTLTVATTDQSAITFTVTGTDYYGRVQTESRAGPNANTVSLKKAFKTITAVANSAAIATNGVSVGFGNILGLPIYLSSAAQVLGESQDGVKPTAGTIVKADAATPALTTGDVRGTYLPNATPDGSKGFALYVAISEPQYLGLTPA